MSPTKPPFVKRKVGADGLTKQQRWLKKPGNYDRVLAKNRERNRAARKKKKLSKMAMMDNDATEKKLQGQNTDLTNRVASFLNHVMAQAMLGDNVLDFLEKAESQDWRDLPAEVDNRIKAIDKVLDMGRRLLRALSHDVKKNRDRWDKVLNQLLGLYSMRNRISIGKDKLRTEEDYRALEELDGDLERLEELERLEGMARLEEPDGEILSYADRGLTSSKSDDDGPASLPFASDSDDDEFASLPFASDSEN